MDFTKYMSAINQRKEEEVQQYWKDFEGAFRDKEMVWSVEKGHIFYHQDITMLDLDEYGYLDDYGYPIKDGIECIIPPMPINHLPKKMLRQKRLSPKNHLRDKAKHGVNKKYWLPRNKRQWDHFVWTNEPDKGKVKEKNSIFKMELDLI